jgi:hypothetical protein
VWYVVTESSDRGYANSHGINYAPKLEAAKGTSAVQTVSVASDGTIDFPAGVDFSPARIVVATPVTGFPVTQFQAGAVGESSYTPLIQLPDGTVLNAPQIANATGVADKVISLDTANGSVVYRETEGRYDNRVVHYVSFDASNPLAAALEDVTYAPALGSAPQAGCSDPAVAIQPCSREGLIAFVNGQTGASNPERQGLNSALVDGLNPLNILKEIPEGQADPGFPAYSPLWDIHLAAWAPGTTPTRQADFGTVEALAAAGQVTSPDGSPLAPAGFIVNCPAVSMNPSH